MFSVKKRVLTVSAALAAFALTFGAPVLGHAAYQLNDEVKEDCPFVKLLGKEGTGLGYVWNIPCPYLSIMPYFFKC